jgi:hypothetical protein
MSDTETGASAPASEPAPDPIEAIVAAWFVQHIHNSPVSRSVEAINCVTAALPALVAALRKG